MLRGSWLVLLFRGRVARLQGLNPATHRRQRPAEVRLELLELLEGIRLRLADDQVRLPLRVLDHLRGMALSSAQDLVLGHGLFGALVGARHDPGRLRVSLGDDALLLPHGPVRLLDLVGEVEADLVDQLHQLVLVEHHLRREWDVTRVLDEVLETVKQLVDLYLYFSFSARAIGGGTRSATLPP